MPLTTIASTIPLPNGVGLPCVGFGVWDSKPDVCVASCQTALREGYRHIDTGDCYGNEEQVGEAVKTCGVPREDIFLATKVLFAKGSVEKSMESITASIERLAGKGGNVEMILIHNATVGADECKELWLALEKLHTQGRVKAIGVSNHGIAHMERMKTYATVWPPHVNQLELHPWCQQREIVAYCNQHGIPIEAYSPLARNTQADHPTLNAIAQAHKVSTAQILIRWSIQKGFVPLPKSDTPARIKSNAQVFDFTLTTDQMRQLNELDMGAKGALVLAVKNG